MKQIKTADLRKVEMIWNVSENNGVMMWLDLIFGAVTLTMVWKVE